MLIGTFRFPSSERTDGLDRGRAGRGGHSPGKRKEKRRGKKRKKIPFEKKKKRAGRQSVSPRFQSELQIPVSPNLDGDAGYYGEPKILRVLPASDDDGGGGGGADDDDDDDDGDNIGIIIYKQCWTAIARWLDGYVIIQLIIAL